MLPGGLGNIRGVAQLGLERGVRDAEVGRSNRLAPIIIPLVVVSIYAVATIRGIHPFYLLGVHKVSMF